jgi:hypothetical protein
MGDEVLRPLARSDRPFLHSSFPGFPCCARRTARKITEKGTVGSRLEMTGEVRFSVLSLCGPARGRSAG